MNIYKERIEALRKEMKKAGIDVYYIPMSDCHNSEYVADHFRCIEYISGFIGSAGSLVITHINPLFPRRTILEEARAVFLRTQLAEAGAVIDL